MPQKLKQILKWSILSCLIATVFLLILFLRKDGSNWLYGFSNWTRQSVENGEVAAGELQNRTIQLVVAFLGGGSLALAGALLQKVTKNKLAEVSILGIGSINIIFIYLYARIFSANSYSGADTISILMPILLIVFSIVGTMIIFAISHSKRANKNTFIIVGIAIQLLAEAISVVIINPAKLTKADKDIWNNIKSYTLGDIKADATSGTAIPWWLIIGAFVIMTIIFVGLFFIRRKIDTYESSPEIAKTSGINVKHLRIILLVVIAVLAALASVLLGTIALLGIIAPSLARMLFKNKFAPLAISSFLIGGLLVCLASWLVMNLDFNLPVGILATAIVIPYFIFLVIKET